MNETILADAPRTGGTTKGELRKAELADYALKIIAEQSYARTSMRDIATAANINLGRLHYYFKDKTGLIVFTVQRFKHVFSKALHDAITAGHSLEGAIDVLVEAATTGAALHRFWYDLRNQALFEPKYRDVVSEIEDQLRQVSTELAKFVDPDQDDEDVLASVYIVLDGLFFRTMQATLYGDATAGTRMRIDLHAFAKAYAG